MQNFIIKLYKKFLYDWVSRDEFLEMRHAINKAETEELSNLLENEWDESISGDGLSKESKDKIQRDLNFYIESEYPRSDNKKTLWVVAAVFLPLLLVGAFLMGKFYYSDKSNDFRVSVDRGNKAVVVLPDQTKVWLNSNSALTYKTNRKKEREVNLTGEAFFKVYKNEKQPFVVMMDNLQVEVLGTSFNAKAREGSDVIETSLVEGRIKVKGIELSQDYYLNPNEKAVFSKSKKQLRVLSTDNDFETAWKDNKLKFSSERFVDVLSMIGDWYGVNIICQYPEIENDLITGTFKEENLETALGVLKLQYDINFIRDKDTIYVVKKH